MAAGVFTAAFGATGFADTLLAEAFATGFVASFAFDADALAGFAADFATFAAAFDGAAFAAGVFAGDFAVAFAGTFAAALEADAFALAGLAFADFDGAGFFVAADFDGCDFTEDFDDFAGADDAFVADFAEDLSFLSEFFDFADGAAFAEPALAVFNFSLSDFDLVLEAFFLSGLAI